MFLQRRVKEYLPNFDNVKAAEKGEVVIIVDNTAPRNISQKGIILDAIKAKSNELWCRHRHEFISDRQ